MRPLVNKCALSRNGEAKVDITHRFGPLEALQGKTIVRMVLRTTTSSPGNTDRAAEMTACEVAVERWPDKHNGAD
ncbi:MAG: hypothetical protein M3305_09900 [Actinomycetota bacterium]|nr:hypothetical protein [Actinomycetota bacterium]